MLWLSAEELLVGLAAIAAAVVLGRLLYKTARRNPDSVFVNDSITADLLCVVEVMLVVAGPMLLLRAVLTAI